MLQDIFPYQFNNSYTRCFPTDNSMIFMECAGQFLLSPIKEPESYLPTYAELPDTLKIKVMQYLFTIDNQTVFWLALDQTVFLSIGWKACPITISIKGAPVWMPLAVTTAAQLVRWYQNHIFCGGCGRKLIHSTTERAMECPSCRIIEYPKIAPVVIVAVVHEGKLLMTHYADRNIKPYVLIAGFVEIGESLEEAAQREVMEEVGLKIKALKYFGSQPWGLSDSLATGFFATVEYETPIILEYEELADARWFTPQDLPYELDNGSLTAAMIEAFRDRMYEPKI